MAKKSKKKYLFWIVPVVLILITAGLICFHMSGDRELAKNQALCLDTEGEWVDEISIEDGITETEVGCDCPSDFIWNADGGCVAENATG